MVTVSSKIDLFTRVVMDKLTASYNLKVKELDQENENLLQEYDKESKQRAEAYIQQFEDDGRIESKKLISKAKMNVRNARIETRQELQKEFESKLKEAIFDFTQGEGYVLFLKERVMNALPELKGFEKIVVELLESDCEKHKAVILEWLTEAGIEADRVAFRTLLKGIAGGLIFYNGNSGVRIDNTLDATMEEHSRVMSRLLSDILDEVGDTNE